MNWAPRAAQTSSGTTSIRPTATGQTFGRTPVSFCFLVAALDHSTVPTTPMAKAATTHQYPLTQSIVGMRRPRLVRNTPGSGWKAWRGEGRACKMPYQNSSCSSNGMSRMTST